MAVLGDVAEAGVLERRAGSRPVTSLARDAHGARRRLAQPGDHLDQLALAVGVDAGEADDLARAHLEGDVAHRGQLAVVGGARRPRPEQRVADLVLGLLDPQQHVAADHQAREAALRRALGLDRVDLLPAPQHGHAVGDVEHLVELVGDEHDRRAVRLPARAGPGRGPATPARSAPRSARRARAPSRRGTARGGSPRAAGRRRRGSRPWRRGRPRARSARRARACGRAAAL